MKSAADPNGHGFYHDGRYATLQDVVGHYNTELALGLTPSEQADIVEYLKTGGSTTSSAPSPRPRCS